MTCSPLWMRLRLSEQEMSGAVTRSTRLCLPGSSTRSSRGSSNGAPTLDPHAPCGEPLGGRATPGPSKATWRERPPASDQDRLRSGREGVDSGHRAEQRCKTNEGNIRGFKSGLRKGGGRPVPLFFLPHLVVPQKFS